MEHDYGKEAEADGTFAFAEGGGQRIVGNEGLFEDMAFDKAQPKPFATGRGGHEFGGDFTGADVSELGGFLGLADVFARGCVEVH